jgi:hypothetical protein
LIAPDRARRTLSHFRSTRTGIGEVFLKHFEIVNRHISSTGQISDAQRRLVGICFAMD